MSLKEYFQKLNSNVSLVVQYMVVQYIKTIGNEKENKSLGEKINVVFIYLFIYFSSNYLK